MTTSRHLLDRREMLALSLAAAAAASLPGSGAAAAARNGAADAMAKRLTGLLADFAEEILRLEPETATSLGLDRGARRALKSRLNSISAAGDARWAAQARSMIARLRRVDRTRLGAGDQLRYDTVMYAATAAEEGTKFVCGRAADALSDNGAAPFPVTQQDGAVTAVPEFLDSQHQIASADDAEAYLDRIRAFARRLDEESARIADQAAHGIAPPSFIASNALGQLTAYRRTPIARQKLVTSLVTRTGKLGIKGDWEARATSLVAKEVYPALDRQIAAFARATEHATDAAGVDRLPEGEAFYRWALKLGTPTDMSPQEIHAVG
ncbi:MAG: DUF885 family protein, partial [Gammaproteobacteria bacterium]|nr:DUF885 family protein [Gammaproteobacteria bacterium]